MTLKSTPSRYGQVAIAIHWSSALAVILAFVAGRTAAGMEVVPGALLLSHITLGLIVFTLTLLRILWWMLADKRPQPAPGLSRWHRIGSGAVHAALYIVLVLMATSGITTVAFSGAIPAIFGGEAVPSFSGLVPRTAHGILSQILLALFVAHVAAALYHQFVRRDRLLARMGIGQA